MPRWRILFFLVVSRVLNAEPVTITVLATTDLHGNLFPYDYFTASPADRGLAGIATLIRAARAESSHVLLIDCGDAIQGSPLEGLYQRYARDGRLPPGLAFTGPALRADPMMLAMNELGYDAMTVGNHEYNFGLANFEKARHDARFPWLSANTEVEPGSRARPLDRYVIKTVGGIKVAVIGITTPSVPAWEKPENYAGYRFGDGVEAARKSVAGLRAQHQPDLILVAAHAGLDRDLDTGRIFAGSVPGENMVYQIATQVEGIDAIVFGHTHQQLAGERVGKVLLAQAKNWGMSIARLDFVFETAPGARPRLQSSSSRLIPANAAAAPDARILELARPYHELTERFLNLPFAASPAALDAALSRVRDTALIDAVHAVQLHYARADISFASAFNPRVRFDKGPVTVRQASALYVYDNELYAIEGDGRMVREALENAARYFRSCADPDCTNRPLIRSDVIGYNFDMAQGVEYEIDLGKPEGSRVRTLTWRGRPLGDQQRVRIAVNHYRYGGSGGYTMFRRGKIVWRSHREIRDLLIDYYTRRKMFPAAADNNWRIVPPAAARSLEREARGDPAPGDR